MRYNKSKALRKSINTSCNLEASGATSRSNESKHVDYAIMTFGMPTDLHDLFLADNGLDERERVVRIIHEQVKEDKLNYKFYPERVSHMKDYTEALANTLYDDLFLIKNVTSEKLALSMMQHLTNFRPRLASWFLTSQVKAAKPECPNQMNLLLTKLYRVSGSPAILDQHMSGKLILTVQFIVAYARALNIKITSLYPDMKVVHGNHMRRGQKLGDAYHMTRAKIEKELSEAHAWKGLKYD